jgi:hypothetical protein
MAVQCVTVKVLYCVTVYILVFGVCYGSAVRHGYSAVLCDTVYIGIWRVLWQCSVARLQCCIM